MTDPRPISTGVVRRDLQHQILHGPSVLIINAKGRVVGQLAIGIRPGPEFRIVPLAGSTR